MGDEFWKRAEDDLASALPSVDDNDCDDDCDDDNDCDDKEDAEKPA